MLASIRTFEFARGALVSVWILLSLAIVAAPYLAVHSHPVAAAFLYLFFSPVCHQNPMRSFTFDGYPWAVCQRCAGIYIGALILSLLPGLTSGMMSQPRMRRVLVFAASVPLLLDASLPVTGIWTNAPWSRFASGMIFGAMISTLLLSGVPQFFSEAPWQRSPSGRPTLNGGISWTRKRC